MTGWHPWWARVLPGLPPHLVFELLAVVVGLMLTLRRRGARKPSPLPVTVCALVGAVLGARLLGLLVDPAETWALRFTPGGWFQQKTVVGGILGGWMGVELAKWKLHIRHSTADHFVQPLIVAMGIGRLGCFFSGVRDRTHGSPSSLPWALDLGDGIPRHPLALYELGILMGLMAITSTRRLAPRQRWRVFVLLYMAWRFVSAPLAPPATVLGPLTTIQIAALVGMVWSAGGLWRGPSEPSEGRVGERSGPVVGSPPGGGHGSGHLHETIVAGEHREER
jgi:prolipoprotein diacylglyceryltransferase